MYYPHGTIGTLLRDKKNTPFKAGDIVVIYSNNYNYKINKLADIMDIQAGQYRGWQTYPHFQMLTSASSNFIPLQQTPKAWITNVLLNDAIPYPNLKRKLVAKAMHLELPISKKLACGTWMDGDKNVLNGVFFLPLLLNQQMPDVRGYNTPLNPLTIIERQKNRSTVLGVYRHFYDDAEYEEAKKIVAADEVRQAALVPNVNHPVNRVFAHYDDMLIRAVEHINNPPVLANQAAVNWLPVPGRGPVGRY